MQELCRRDIFFMIHSENLLVTITTTPNSDWRDKIKEINRLGLKSVALFPTCLERAERDEMYCLLEKTKLKTIPFTHLREEDMGWGEINYLIKKWKCQVFNVHAMLPIFRKNFSSQCKDKIYVENGTELLTEKNIDGFAGICLDFTHLENDRRLRPKNYKAIIKLIKKHKIGCAHFGAIADEMYVSRYKRTKRCDLHWANSVLQFDYLKKYQKKMFPKYIALELENSLKDQIKFKNYIIKLLSC